MSCHFLVVLCRYVFKSTVQRRRPTPSYIVFWLSGERSGIVARLQGLSITHDDQSCLSMSHHPKLASHQLVQRGKSMFLATSFLPKMLIRVQLVARKSWRTARLFECDMSALYAAFTGLLVMPWQIFNRNCARKKLQGSCR